MNPYGCHMNVLTGPAKNTALKQRNGNILKVLEIDREFLSQWRDNNPNGVIIYRRWFDDNNLDDWKGRCDGVIEEVINSTDLISVVETPWNETDEGINEGIKKYVECTIQAANYLRGKLPTIKVSGGHFSVGTPYGIPQDYDAFSLALPHLDYLSLHEYDFPHVDTGVKYQDNKTSGYMVFRYRNWLESSSRVGVKMPPIILSEFGRDGGDGKGWKSVGDGIGNYMDELRRLAPYLNQDIEKGVLLGAVLFCVGQIEPWANFDLAGNSEFETLLNEVFDMPTPTVVPKQYHPVEEAQTVTEFSQWASDPKNEHVPGTPEYLTAFVRHREGNAGVNKGTYSLSAALDGGFPRAMFYQIQNKNLQPRYNLIQHAANYLGVPTKRIGAVYKVESAGEPFGFKGNSFSSDPSNHSRAIIRFEAHLWLKRVPDDKKEWAKASFRSDGGFETVFDGEKWIPLQNKNQAGRWLDLTLAVAIDRDNAFECTSMGLFQILGEHYKRLGYKSAEKC